MAGYTHVCLWAYPKLSIFYLQCGEQIISNLYRRTVTLYAA